MRTQQLFTNHRCNQSCVFCTFRRETDDLRAIAPAALLAGLDRALADGARSIVFTGGEPTMRRDLAELVGRARARGAEEIVVETNATLVDLPLATALVAAGMTVARVHLPRATPSLDDLTRDPGGFERARYGLAALREAGAPIEISVTVVRSTVPDLACIPATARAWLGDSLRRVLVRVPDESPDPHELLTHGEAADAILPLVQACRAEGVTVQLGRKGPPPCAFPARDRPHHLYALQRGGAADEGFRQPDDCAACVVREICPGLSAAYLARHPDARVAPIRDDRARRRLSMHDSVERQIARELVQPSYPSTGPEEALVRVNFHCNQACDFCFVSTHLPSAAHDTVRRAIDAAAAAGKRVVLTGGEPTLNAHLVDYVRLASERSGGAWPVEIQTNAVLLDQRARVDDLVRAGLGAAFVSLHGSTAAVSDAVTRAPGTFTRTLAGIDNLVAAKLRVVLNFVICTANQDDLPAVVDLAGARWPGVPLSVSFIAPSTDLVPREPWLVPRYSDALPRVIEAYTRARTLGVRLLGFESMCGLPLCLVPPELTTAAEGRVLPDGRDEGEFLRAEACDACERARECWGVRRGYASIHGTAELRTLKRAEPS